MQVEITQFEKLDNFCREFGLIEKLWVARQQWKENYENWEI